MVRPQGARKRWLWLVVSSAVIIAVVIALLLWQPAGIVGGLYKPLVGTWTRSDATRPGVTRMLIFHPDGTLVSRDISTSTGTTLQDFAASWRVEGRAIVYQKHSPGIARMFDRLLGTGPPKERIEIISLSPTELRVGSAVQPITYKRLVPQGQTR